MIPAPMRAALRYLLNTWRIATIFLVLSALYFTDTLLRASLKTFWFDELYTVYLCRLPTFQATWTAVLHGCDFNPPIFYLLTRGSQHLFGEGLIATRLPAILGFWIFAMCLYGFAARRLGRMCGLVAALAPLFTLAGYYTYEARPHGVVLGCCGLMLVCWQRARDRRRRFDPWLAGLSGSFLAALFTHVYAVYLAVPFFLIEAGNLLGKRRVHFGACAALLAPLALAVPIYLPMIRAYRILLGGQIQAVHLVDTLRSYLVATYGPGLVVLIIAVAILASRSANGKAEASLTPCKGLSRDEQVLAYALLTLPVLGALSLLVANVPFFDRYFLYGTAGYALLLAQAASSCNSRIPSMMAKSMIFFLAADLTLSALFRFFQFDLHQVEPSSHFVFSTTPRMPLLRNRSLSEQPYLDILITAEPAYLYLHFYAPPALRQRLVFGAPDDHDFFFNSYRSLAQWGRVDLRTATYDAFFATHSDFLVYATTDGRFNGRCGDCLDTILAAGYTLRSVRRDQENLLEHFSR